MLCILQCNTCATYFLFCHLTFKIWFWFFFCDDTFVCKLCCLFNLSFKKNATIVFCLNWNWFLSASSFLCYQINLLLLYEFEIPSFFFFLFAHFFVFLFFWFFFPLLLLPKKKKQLIWKVSCLFVLNFR